MTEENKKTEKKKEKTTDKSVEQNTKEDEVKTDKNKLGAKVETKPEKEIKQKSKIQKTEAIVNGKSLPISTKQSVAVCKFIKGKKIEDAIAYLEDVVKIKKAIPMKGEIPHRKGMMSGRFPKNTSQQFIKLLKNLSANATANGLEEPIIVEAIANIANRPYGRFGRTRKKRTHVTVKVKEKKLLNKNKLNKK